MLFDKDTEKIWLSNISSAFTKHFQEPLHFCVSQIKSHRPDPLKSKLEWSWCKSGREWEVKTWWGLKSQQGVIFTDFHSGKRWKRWFFFLNSLSHILWSLFISRVSEQLCGSWGSLGKVAPGEAQRSEGNQNRVVREVYWSKTKSREGRRPLIALF